MRIGKRSGVLKPVAQHSVHSRMSKQDNTDELHNRISIINSYQINRYRNRFVVEKIIRLPKAYPIIETSGDKIKTGNHHQAKSKVEKR
jgi:hypothetical protein